MTSPAVPPGAYAAASPWARAATLIASGKTIAFLACAAFTVLGFSFLTPPAKFAAVAATDAVQDSTLRALDRRVTRNEQLLRTNNNAWCVTLTARERALAGLDCAGIPAR